MQKTDLRILIAPLNWGLGHAARCIPIASALREAFQGVEIHWASDGQSKSFLEKELPCDFVHTLPSYGITYPTKFAVFNMLLNSPRMVWAMQQEQKVVARLHKQYSFDFILSDNRYGCRVKGVHNAILTHQIHMPLPSFLVRYIANNLNHRWLAKFDEILVPDFSNEKRCSGKMGAQHPYRQTTYLGPISRFARLPKIQQKQSKRLLTIVLSGPEPQRTYLESKILSELVLFPSNFVDEVQLIRGLPNNVKPIARKINSALNKLDFQFYATDFLTSKDLFALLSRTEVLVTRPGYTTVMDLAVINKQAIFIPTPGQPEQESLGRSLAEANQGITRTQEQLALVEAIRTFRKLKPIFRKHQLASELAEWILKLKNRFKGKLGR